MNLSWIDVDPDLHSYNPKTAKEIAVNVIESSPHEGPLWKENIENKIDQSFCDAFGSWAAGWKFSKGEGSGSGGVITSWCCPSHSILAENDQVDIQGTAERAVNALIEWHNHLQHLKQYISQYPLILTDETTAGLELYNACTHIISYVVVATDAEDAWYAYAEQVLSWYLQFLGLTPEHADQIVKKVLSGKFESWVMPNKETVHNIAQQYKRSVLANIMGI
jgi:hypothetical protein